MDVKKKNYLSKCRKPKQIYVEGKKIEETKRDREDMVGRVLKFIGNEMLTEWINKQKYIRKISKNKIIWTRHFKAINWRFEEEKEK